MMDRRQLGIMMAVTLAIAGGLVAKAQTGDFGGPPPRLIPYTGYLENNGVPVTRVLDMTFWFYSGESELATQLLEEIHRSVEVVNGRFSVTLGSTVTTGLPAALLDSSEVWLQIAVDDPTDEVGATTLAGRQRLLAAPYALQSDRARLATKASGSDWFNVGSMTLRSDLLEATGDIHIKPMKDDFLGGTLHVQGGLSMTSEAWFWNGVRITTDRNRPNPGAGSLYVQNNLTVDGNVTVTNCCVCLCYGDVNATSVGSRRTVCGQLANGSGASLNLSGTVNSDDKFGIMFTCGSACGTSLHPGEYLCP